MESTMQANAKEELGSKLEEARRKVQGELDAMGEGGLVPITVDVPAAITTVLGALPRLAALRSRIERELPALDLAQLDRLETYALATGHAHTQLAASTEGASLQALAAELTQKREVLLADATALARRGLVDGRRFQDLKGPVGYRNVAFDVLTLLTVVRESWPAVEGKTAITLVELRDLEALAERLLGAIGGRDVATLASSRASAERQRAFTLMARAYDQARRAVSYLLWDAGDDAINGTVPSLYRGRGNVRRARDAEDAPVVGGPSEPEKPAADPAEDEPREVVPPGLPGSNPFIS